LAAANNPGILMPLASLLHDRFLTLLAHGGDRLDWSAIGTPSLHGWMRAI
jgi:hypothetical protein